MLRGRRSGRLTDLHFLSGIVAPLRRRWGPNLLLAALLLTALLLRLYGIDWDDGHGFHPDERSFYLRADDMFRTLTAGPGHERWLAEWPGMESGIPGFRAFLSAERSPLNPHWFPLGSVLIYALVLVRSVAELFTDWSALDMRFAGRALSALADTGSVAMMYLIGRRMYGRWTGLLAAALVTFAVIHIQHAHFYRPEPFTVLTSLAALWAMLRFVDGRRARDAALLGALVGLAMAPKVSVAPMLAPLALSFLWVAKDRAGGGWSDLTVPAAVRMAPMLLLSGACALAVFAFTTPYALLDFGAFIGDIKQQTAMARDAWVFPFARQYIDAPAFLYQIRQVAVWGVGLPLGIALWLAAPFTAWMAWRDGRTQRGDLLLLAWAVPAFVFLELFEVKFLRYVFPLVPFYLLMTARMLTAAISWGQESRRRAVVAKRFYPEDAPFSEEWHATPPTVGDDVIFDEPLAGDAPFSEEWHATPPLAGATVSSLPSRRAPRMPSTWRRFVDRWALPAGVALLVAVLAGAVLYAVAFVGIYSRPHTAVTASEWINNNVPLGSRIINGGSFWDERIPDLSRYSVWTFPAYELDSETTKIPELVEQLASSDYVVFYSNRAYGSVARLPDRYPHSAAFYRELFAGRLGYRLDRAFTSYPSLAGVSLRDDPYGRSGLSAPPLAGTDADDGQPGGVIINLGYADENVIGYDHPQVLVFRNVERFSAEDLGERIDASASAPGATTPLMLPPDALASQRSGGTWSQVFDRDGWPARVPGLAWLLVIELICLAAFPLTWWLMRSLPDRGILLARVVGLLLVSWVSWVLVSAGVLQFSAGTVWLALLIVAIPSGLVLWRQWRQMLDWLARRWRLVVTAEALFLLAYLGFLLIRAANPDLWHPWRGGEKPMELAYFTAVARSTVLPPYDPWFSGGYLNYYYWGYFILSVPTRLTGIPPATAFNVSVPLLFALTATGVGSLVYNLVAAAGGTADGGRESDGRRGFSRFLRWAPGGALIAGVAAAIMATVAGNLDGVVQLAQLAKSRSEGVVVTLANFDFWRSSRAIPVLDDFEPSRLTPWIEGRGWVETGFHITEFPFFTFLFADLHAHMMTMPFAVLGLALGLNLLLGLAGRRAWPDPWAWICAAGLGLAVGSLWAINSWEYPAYALLMVGICAAAAWMAPGSLRTRLCFGGALVALALAVSYVAFWPFHAQTETFGTGIEATRWRTPLANFLLIHALLLLGAAALLTATLPRASALLINRLRGGGRLPAHHQWILVLVGLGIVLTLYLLAAGYLTAGLLTIALSLTGWALLAAVFATESPHRRSDVMALGMLALALAVGIGVEILRVEGDIARMNTVFKYYLVAWLLYAAVAGYGFWRGWSSSAGNPSRLKRGVRMVSAGAVAIIAVGVLVYPALAIPVRINDRFGKTPLTLNGAAWMPEAVHWERETPITLRWDADAIRWLQDNVAGTPVVLEAHGDQYRWNGRISVYTGLPTVLGWPWHQTQQRNDPDAVRARASDISRMYNNPDRAETQRLLAEYSVAYIVVGDLERIYYRPEGIAKFDAMAADGVLDLVFANEGTSIYEVSER